MEHKYLEGETEKLSGTYTKYKHTFFLHILDSDQKWALK